MVTFPDLSNLNGTSGIGGFLSLPNATYPYFWAWILAGLWFIISSTLYFKEREKRTVGNFLSAMSVSCMAVLILAVIGTIVGFISNEIMVYMAVMSFVIIGVWFFSSNR